MNASDVELLYGQLEAHSSFPIGLTKHLILPVAIWAIPVYRLGRGVHSLMRLYTGIGPNSCAWYRGASVSVPAAGIEGHPDSAHICDGLLFLSIGLVNLMSLRDTQC